MNPLFSDFSCSPAKLQSSSSISRNCCYLKKAHRKFNIQLFEYLDTNKLSKISSVLNKPNLEEKESTLTLICFNLQWLCVNLICIETCVLSSIYNVGATSYLARSKFNSLLVECRNAFQSCCQYLLKLCVRVRAEGDSV